MGSLSAAGVSQDGCGSGRPLLREMSLGSDTESLGGSARGKRLFERGFGTVCCLKGWVNSDGTLDLTRFLCVSVFVVPSPGPVNRLQIV